MDWVLECTEHKGATLGDEFFFTNLVFADDVTLLAENVRHIGVGTGGSSGSMNRGPRAPGATSSGATEKFLDKTLRKIIKIVVILRLKCTKFDFGWGSAPVPAGGVYSAPPDSLAGFGQLWDLRFTAGGGAELGKRRKKGRGRG